MRKITFLFYALGLVILVLGCAQQSSPTGGPKDVTPPTLVRSVPVNQTTRYEGKRIELEFDEYVSVDNINQQLLITPALEGNYTVKIRPKGATLNLEKSLRPYTTYSFNFRETFKDVTERNPARNVKLVFSTGALIDSLSVRGTVTDVLTGKPLLEATVGLYPISDTLQFSKVRPYYFARTDSAGTYALENLKPDTYRLATFTDGNNNVLYDAAKERIGFEADSFKLTGNLSNRDLQVAFADRSPNRVVTTRPAINYYTVVYAKGVKGVKVRFQTPADSLPYLFLDEKQLRFFNVKNAVDTIRASIEATDSLDLVFRHEQKIKFRPKGRREEGTREAFEVKTTPADRAETPNPLVYKIRFNKPIQRYDLKQISILGDTLNRAELSEQNLSWNETRNELTITTPFRGDKGVRVSIPKATFISVEQDSNQVIRTYHPLFVPENYGTIRGTVTGKNTGFIVELLDENYKVLQSQRDQAKYEFRYVRPGTYFVRLVVDRNGNGRWDPGDARKFEQPERILFLPSKIPAKADWEVSGNDFQID